MFDRRSDRERVQRALARSRAVLLLGARQVGKSTLARAFAGPDPSAFFDLEDPADLARLDEPMTALAPLRGTVIIDEVQRRPELFPILRVLCDRRPLPAKFLILGSASEQALRQSSESLAGRLELVELGGIALEDWPAGEIDARWRRGGYPESLAAASDVDSFIWRTQYLRLLASRDLAAFGVGADRATVERFLAAVSGYHGQLWNAAAIARLIRISETAVRKYMDALEDALVIRVLRPLEASQAKRLVKTPKVYFRDSGLVHALLDIADLPALLRHPIAGASWEGIVIEEILRIVGPSRTPGFWRTSNGAELDLVLRLGARWLGFEIKRADAPRMTASLHSALADLDLERVLVVYPGSAAYVLHDRVEAVPVADLPARVRALFPAG